MSLLPQLPGLDRPKRKPPRVMAKLEDAGGENDDTWCHYRCRKCGWDSGWIIDNRTDSEIRRGMPCETCNAPQ